VDLSESKLGHISNRFWIESPFQHPPGGLETLFGTSFGDPLVVGRAVETLLVGLEHEAGQVFFLSQFVHGSEFRQFEEFLQIAAPVSILVMFTVKNVGFTETKLTRSQIGVIIAAPKIQRYKLIDENNE
jgi:hypothetical protein